MESTLQGLRFAAVTVLSIMLLAIVGAVLLSPVHALGPTMSLNVSPNPALPDQDVTFSGQVSPHATPADSIKVYVWSGTQCFLAFPIEISALSVNLVPSVLATFIFTGSADGTGSYSITATGGFSAGTYSVQAVDTTASLHSSCDPFTVSPVIPEYPFGLSILAIFMLLGYGVIRRRATQIIP